MLALGWCLGDAWEGDSDSDTAMGPPASICSTQEGDTDEGLSLAAMATGRCHLEFSGVLTHPKKAVTHPTPSRLPQGSVSWGHSSVWVPRVAQRHPSTGDLAWPWRQRPRALRGGEHSKDRPTWGEGQSLAMGSDRVRVPGLWPSRQLWVPAAVGGGEQSMCGHSEFVWKQARSWDLFFQAGGGGWGNVPGKGAAPYRPGRLPGCAVPQG